MRQKERRYSLGNIGILLVFCGLAFCLLMTMLLGARIYRKVTAQAEENNNRRTMSQYIANRVRQADTAEMVSVEDFSGVSALTIRQTIDETVYLTRIYCYDGWLCELFSAESSGLSPEDGEQLVPAQDLSFALESGLLTAQVRHSDGSSRILTLYLRSGEGVL